MSKTDPFVSYISQTLLEETVKNLEQRWGLTLISFLPEDAQRRVRQLQCEVGRLWDSKDDGLRESRMYVSFYEPEHFHCTHVTFTRSDPRGPVRVGTFVKDGHRQYELFLAILEVTLKLAPIEVKLDRMVVAHDGLGIILLGQCEGEDSVRGRQFLLEQLNRSLPQSFNLSSRGWDTDPSKFHEIHCAIGYLKRPPSQGYNAFVEHIKGIRFEPFVFTLDSVALVHHRYRSLALPQEGMVTFPLGKKVDMTEAEFAHYLNLIP